MQKSFEAHYKASPVRLYRGNPLIEALPDILSEEEAFDILKHEPPIPTAEDRRGPAHIRRHELALLRDIVRPTNDYIAFEPMFSTMLRSGYVDRNPKNPEYWTHLYHGKEVAAAGRKVFSPPMAKLAGGQLVMGLSGLGKSTMIRRILRLYPQVIRHRGLDGENSLHTQIVYVHVSAPVGGTVLALGDAIIRSIAEAVGDKGIRRTGSTDELIDYIFHLARAYFIGVIVIDDLQRLNESHPNQQKIITGFLTKLAEDVGVPILAIGTYSVEAVFRSAFKDTRKFTGHGTHTFYHPSSVDDQQWDDLVEFVWQYQWLKAPQKLTPEIKKELYFQAVGIPDMLIKLWHLSQVLAISSGDEKISVQTIRDVASNELRLVQPALQILRKRKLGVLRADEALRYEDLFPRDIWSNNLEEQAYLRGLGADEKGPATKSINPSPNQKKEKAQQSVTAVSDFRKILVEGESRYSQLRSKGLVAKDCHDVS